MYLKSIEIHGFKSFANKTLLKFDHGITGVVGPNGSGKSNVADAVRWVLGEQSAKQLRGTSMQDIIFAGSDAKKPLGYAYVTITFDNSDGSLAASFEEVSVTRRVYRSGESEYLINNAQCRLKDIQEMFMDTGIGKEGYSVIGQGQIDKILSTKPEDRRELFDEAAGIVKFKRRKTLAEKDLAEQQDNMERIFDILTEINRQAGPLKKQEEVAREYLKLREQLRSVEVNQFLLDYEKTATELENVEKKLGIVSEDYRKTSEEYAGAKGEYERLDNELNDYRKALLDGRSYEQELSVGIEKLDGEERLIRERLDVIAGSLIQTDERTSQINLEIDRRKSLLSDEEKKLAEYKKSGDSVSELIDENTKSIGMCRSEIENTKLAIEKVKSDMAILSETDSSAAIDITRLKTLSEQCGAKKQELKLKLETSAVELENSERREAQLRRELREMADKITSMNADADGLLSECEAHEAELASLVRKHEEKNSRYLMEVSKLESMKNIAERYDGYGNAIKRVMERKSIDRGIVGVVADVIKVDKKYETAIETALSGNIQNIITDTEATAKGLIEFLKKEKLGRATFLPLDAVRGGEEHKLPVNKGVIDYANRLVSCDKKYEGCMKHLLGQIVVTDTVDNAAKLAREYNYTLKIVTLEGEFLAPGGSISGGAYKNSGNLLGRNREIEEMKKNVSSLKAELEAMVVKRDELIDRIAAKKLQTEEIRGTISKLYVDQNTLVMNVNRECEKRNEIVFELNSFKKEIEASEARVGEISSEIAKLEEGLSKSTETKETLLSAVEIKSAELDMLYAKEKELLSAELELKLASTDHEKNVQFAQDNIQRIKSETDTLFADLSQIEENARESRETKDRSQKNLDECIRHREQSIKKLEQLKTSLTEINLKLECTGSRHKSFLDTWEQLGARVNELDKESYRLSAQRDKLNDQSYAQTNYIWTEYELTYSTAEAFRSEEYSSYAANRKQISSLKLAIKDLGDVNVNAIEDYKDLAQRQEFLSTQYADLSESAKSIREIIARLDDEMRKKFEQNFASLNKQFDICFKELFGGGKGTLELVENEDVLEAGIRIIAQPPGKKLQNMMQLSGGEKALTAISLLFAIQNMKPSPFCLLDEIEAALDEPNVKRFANYLKKLTRRSQFIVITHRRGTMECCDTLYGITMQEKGVSALVSVSMIEGQMDN